MSFSFRSHAETVATLQGLAAIGLWSLTFGLARSASERLGPLTAGAAVYGIAGGFVLAVRLLARGKREGNGFRPDPRATLLCGSLFTGYMLALYWAVGHAVSHVQVLEVGLLNYLWPVLTLLGTVFFLGHFGRRRILATGTLFALGGITLALAPAGGVPFASAIEAPLPLLLGFGAAVMWAAYSVLVRHFSDAGVSAGPVEGYLLVTALLLFLSAFFSNEPRGWNAAASGEVVSLGISTGAAYLFWARAMARGRMDLVVSASYLTPFLATLFSALYLGTRPDARFWIGCAFLVAGSIVSHMSMQRA